MRAYNQEEFAHPLETLAVEHDIDRYDWLLHSYDVESSTLILRASSDFSHHFNLEVSCFDVPYVELPVKVWGPVVLEIANQEETSRALQRAGVSKHKYGVIALASTRHRYFIVAARLVYVHFPEGIIELPG